eukprot:NODE_2443_length_2211_cov_9.298944.p1 GENE.NODE_2443_length_2211_cov_9.298944~~NODE_2443_length_2211_cov_9.298944.p1  ORF type:complete len:698 (+),score=190.53 NODE_2443_length_2211_cov_9.298944:208-2094(+)
MQPSERPWFTWSGGRRAKQTQHLHVVDAASLQFANPLHAQFVLHLCGYTAKLALCHATLRLGVLRHVSSSSVIATATTLAGPRWEEARRVVHEAVEASTAFPWGWPEMDLPPAGDSIVRDSVAAHVARWESTDGLEQPGVAPVAVPPTWSLAALRDAVGDECVPADDVAPLRADDRPRAGTLPSRTIRLPLWQVCDYVRGLPPPVHRVLGSLDARRLWRVAHWLPWENDTSPPLELDINELRVSAPRVNVHLLRGASLHIAPPGAKIRLHCPSTHSRTHFAIWQLEGSASIALFPPAAASALAHDESTPPLFDASQSLVDPWATAGACPGMGETGVPAPLWMRLHAGEVLLLPVDWWMASVALAPSLALWRPWFSKRRLAEQLSRGCAAAAPGEPVHSREQISRLTAELRREPSRLSTSLPICKKAAAGTGAKSSRGRDGEVLNAVLHMSELAEDGRLLQSSRPVPQVLAINYRSVVPPGMSAAMVDVVQSMNCGDVVLSALRNGSGMSVCEVKLLSFVAAETASAPSPAAPAGGWRWFGAPENWLGAPAGHEPVDQVEEARRREVAEAAGSTAQRRCSASGRATRGWRKVAHVASPLCRRRSWLARRRSAKPPLPDESASDQPVYVY